MSQVKTAGQAGKLFQDILVVKRDVRNLNENKKAAEENLIDYIEQNGPILSYNLKDQPVVLTVEKKEVVKLDKDALALHVNLPKKDLTEKKIAELVENGELSSDDIDRFYKPEIQVKLKAKRAKKDDVDKYQGQV